MPCRDVSFGGVLCAVPALKDNGLFAYLEKLPALPAGFYQLTHVMVLLACMALCRIRTTEQLRNQPPGELGKLLGLDRIPEVRTLREKLGLLSQDSAALAAWSEALAEHWMAGDVEAAGVLYVDGHVRVYHGELAVLPKRYVSRQRLCLRGTTDYWVNDLIGQPYFVVSREFNEGLGQVLREEIVQRYQQAQTELREQIVGLEEELAGAKKRRREVPKRIAISELAAEQRIKRLLPGRKQLMDTIKMIAYRAETGLCGLLREELGRVEDARPLVRDLFRRDVNLCPQPEQGRLLVEVHHVTNPQADHAVAKLLEKLNALQCVYPGTNLALHYTLVSPQMPRDQEV